MSVYCWLKHDSVLQHVLSMDPMKLGYTEEGHCHGEPHPNLPGPQRLQWDIPAEVRVGLKRTSSHNVFEQSCLNGDAQRWQEKPAITEKGRHDNY